MFGFIEFLRVVSVGLISLILLGLIFYKSVLYIDATWILMISTLLGLIIQPFLRTYHPFRSNITDIIKHVQIYIDEAISQEEKKGSYPNQDLENALARAIYEYCIRTFQSAETFTDKVNEQIRFFYFYYFIAISLKISCFCIIIVSLIKIINEHTTFLLFSPFIGGIVSNEFLMGINNIAVLFFVSISSLAISLLLARRFYLTAKGIMMNELDTRHVFILDQKQKIQELARASQNDEKLLELLVQFVDKEKGSRK